MEKTAKALDLPLPLVKKIVSYQFKTIEDNFRSWKYIGFRLENLGSFFMTKRSTRIAIEKLISAARRLPDNSYRKTLHNLWKIRHQASLLEESKKFKKRFGS